MLAFRLLSREKIRPMGQILEQRTQRNACISFAESRQNSPKGQNFSVKNTFGPTSASAKKIHLTGCLSPCEPSKRTNLARCFLCTQKGPPIVLGGPISHFSLLITHFAQRAIGPCPKQLVVVMAVRKAVRAATTTFTATSTIRFVFITFTFQSSKFLDLKVKATKVDYKVQSSKFKVSVLPQATA